MWRRLEESAVKHRRMSGLGEELRGRLVGMDAQMGWGGLGKDDCGGRDDLAL